MMSLSAARPSGQTRNCTSKLSIVMLRDGEEELNNFPFLSCQADPKMLAILLSTLVLHLIDLIILFVATCANAWKAKGSESFHLWYHCEQTNGGSGCSGTHDADWLQAVQALMVLATIFCLTSFIIFLCQLFTLVKGGRFFFTAVFQILASLFVMSGAIIYTVMSEKKGDESWGYAFVLAWLAFPLTLISGFIYIVLRKKE